jgi:amino acid transporter
MGTWEVILSATAAGLTNGGTGGMIWMFIGSFICFGTIVLSLAEMSSMAPTAGGQYHWASEFSPRSHQRFISYMAGWLSTLSWQCGTCSGMFLLGTQIQGLVAITHGNYEAQAWHGYLLVIGMASLGLLLNTWGAKQLPLIEGIILVFHVFGWATVLIVLWILSPKNSPSEVFTTFENSGGWSSMGLSMLVGQVTAIYGLIGSDGAAHMAEETKDASIIVPRCMIWSYLLNGSMGFVMLVTYCFCLTDVDAALDSASGFPYIYVFQSGTGSTGGAVGLTSIIIVLGLAVSLLSRKDEILLMVLQGATSFFASTSRQTFAFARDKGLPGYRWIGAVHPKLMIPLNAILVTFAFTILLSLINLGSTFAL